jgi:hypothetical protein
MTKKSRRARRKSRPTATLVVDRATIDAVSAPQEPETPATPDFHEYAYVITDLRRVAILAAAMFGLLIALSFFIR